MLAQRVEEAAKELSLAVEVQKVTNMDEIMEYDILMTPGLVLDEKLVVSGRDPSVEEIKGLLK